MLIGLLLKLFLVFPILVQVQVSAEFRWEGTNLVTDFVSRPRGAFPELRSTLTLDSTAMTATQAAAQFKSQFITWFGQQAEYKGFGTLQAADVSVSGGFQ